MCPGHGGWDSAWSIFSLMIDPILKAEVPLPDMITFSLFLDLCSENKSADGYLAMRQVWEYLLVRKDKKVNDDLHKPIVIDDGIIQSALLSCANASTTRCFKSALEFGTSLISQYFNELESISKVNSSLSNTPSKDSIPLSNISGKTLNSLLVFASSFNQNSIAIKWFDAIYKERKVASTITYKTLLQILCLENEHDRAIKIAKTLSPLELLYVSRICIVLKRDSDFDLTRFRDIVLKYMNEAKSLSSIRDVLVVLVEYPDLYEEAKKFIKNKFKIIAPVKLITRLKDKRAGIIEQDFNPWTCLKCDAYNHASFKCKTCRSIRPRRRLNILPDRDSYLQGIKKREYEMDVFGEQGEINERFECLVLASVIKSDYQDQVDEILDLYHWDTRNGVVEAN